ncbi:hypothetical protein ACO1O0_007621 [Amphichorda felina]
MDHTGDFRGRAPHLDDADSYEVFKTVEAGDGAGIQDAIDSGSNGNSRHNQWLASEPRVVYLPSGTYEVSQTINLRTDTILMGDARNPPVIKAAAGFNGETLLNGRDTSVGDSGEISFAVGVKNVILDTTSVDAGQEFTALFWGVAQVCHLAGITIKMPSAGNGQGHSGIKLGRGSTLGLSDIRIEKGLNGIWQDGHQQAMYKSVYFHQNTVGMLVSGGNTITILNPTFDSVGTAVKHTGGSPFIGIIDAKSINSGVTFDSSGYPSLLIDNLDKDTDSNIVQLPGGTALGQAKHVDTFTYGNTVGRDPIYGDTTSSVARPEAVAPGGRIPAVAAPSFSNNSVSDFINVKDPDQNGGQTIKGDASVDEVEALQKVLDYAAEQKKIAYFPFGDYRVESTLVIPIGSRIVGEAWSTISAAGDFFKDGSNPKPVIQVGKQGDGGVAQILDMRFTVADVLPGAIIMQFNAAGTKPGDVAIWNSVITVGGTRGATPLTESCGDASNTCQAAYIGMHFTEDSSVYVENVWNWVADHITEDFEGGSSISGKGGALVESTKGTWLHALGSEHWWLYQLNLRSASNVVVSMLQTETNYEQGDNAEQVAPAPWTPDVEGWGDPDFSHCEDGDKRCHMGYSNFIQGGSDIYYYGSASWAFFSGPRYQTCSDGQCQDYIHWIETTPENFQGYGFCSKDTRVVLRLADGTDIESGNGFSGSWGGLVGRYTP